VAALDVEADGIGGDGRFDPSRSKLDRKRFRQLDQNAPETLALPRFVDRDTP
jgi:hypothetical protein